MQVDPRIKQNSKIVEDLDFELFRWVPDLFVDIQLAELRLALEHDKEFSLSEQRQKYEEEKKKEIEEIKKKQWVRSYEETFMLSGKFIYLNIKYIPILYRFWNEKFTRNYKFRQSQYTWCFLKVLNVNSWLFTFSYGVCTHVRVLLACWWESWIWLW